MANYPVENVSPSFAELEEKTLENWQENRIFEKSVARNPRVKD